MVKRSLCVILILLYTLLNICAQEPLLRFGLFTDTQAAPKESRPGRYYLKSPEKLRQAVADFNDNGAKLAVSLGDFSEGDIATLEKLTCITDSLRIPLYHLMGNHEFVMGRMPQIERLMKVEPPYYRSVRSNGVRLIMLNSNQDMIYSTVKGTPQRAKAEEILAQYKQQGALNAQAHNGMIASEQFAWLEKELKEACAANEIVIVMSHHTLVYLFDIGAMLNKNEVIELLKKYPCVKAHFSGHTHRGGYFELDGIHYLNFMGMVETPNNRYALIDVFKDKIVVMGRGDESSRELKFKKNTKKLILRNNEKRNRCRKLENEHYTCSRC